MNGEPASQVIRIATYNVHGCVGTDGVFCIPRIGEVIAGLDAQVVGLQEVDSSPQSEQRADLEQLAEATGLTAVAGGIRAGARGTYGNALLTNLPVLRSRTLDLSVHGREPRGALEVYVKAEDAIVRIVVAHLGLAPWERREQSRRLVETLASTPTDIEATILLGDVNEWFTWGRPLRWLHAALGRSAHIATFPSILPMFALDRIWVRPRASLQRSWRVRNNMTRRASDHLPLRADIMLSPRL